MARILPVWEMSAVDVGRPGREGAVGGGDDRTFMPAE